MSGLGSDRAVQRVACRLGKAVDRGIYHWGWATAGITAFRTRAKTLALAKHRHMRPGGWREITVNARVIFDLDLLAYRRET